MTVFAWSDCWRNGSAEVLDWDLGLVDRQGRAKPALAAVASQMVGGTDAIACEGLGRNARTTGGAGILPDASLGNARLASPNPAALGIPPHIVNFAPATAVPGLGQHARTTGGAGMLPRANQPSGFSVIV
jgi:hypothetical protein